MATDTYLKEIVDEATEVVLDLSETCEEATNRLEMAVKSFLFTTAVDKRVVHTINQDDNQWVTLRDQLVDDTLVPQGTVNGAYFAWRDSVDEMVEASGMVDTINAECKAVLNGTTQQIIGLPMAYIKAEMNKASDFGGFGAGDMSTMIANRLPRRAQVPNGLDILKGAGSTSVGAIMLVNINDLNARMVGWSAEMQESIARMKRTEDIADIEVVIPLLKWAYNGIVDTKNQMLGTIIQVNDGIQKLNMAMQELGTVLPTKLNITKDLELKIADIQKFIDTKNQRVDGLSSAADYLGQLAAGALNAHNTVAHLIDSTQA